MLDLTLIAKARLHLLGATADQVKVAKFDERLGLPNQLVYVARPTFGKDLQDPFPGEARHLWLQGKRRVVRADVLKEQVAEALAGLPEQTVAALPKTPRPQGRKAAGTSSRRRAPQPMPNIVSFDAEKWLRQADAEMHVMRTGGTGYLAACLSKARARKVRELIKLLRSRFPAGVPEGQRYTLATPLACSIVAALPKDQLTAERAREACLAILSAAGFSMEWLRVEWFGEGMDQGIVARVRLDAEGIPKILATGKRTTWRFEYNSTTLIDHYSITETEMFDLKFETLLNERVRQQLRREAQGCQTAAEIQTAHRRHDPAVLALAAKGLSIRAISAELGGAVSPKTVARIINRAKEHNGGDLTMVETTPEVMVPECSSSGCGIPTAVTPVPTPPTSQWCPSIPLTETGDLLPFSPDHVPIAA